MKTTIALVLALTAGCSGAVTEPYAPDAGEVGEAAASEASAEPEAATLPDCPATLAGPVTCCGLHVVGAHANVCGCETTGAGTDCTGGRPVCACAAGSACVSPGNGIDGTACQ